MARQLKTFIFYEIGKTCRTEFLMKDGTIQPTEDAVVIGIVEGEDEASAFSNLMQSSPWLNDYAFETVVVREIRE